jgi:D-threo-aldose 1-dehydrogenase
VDAIGAGLNEWEPCARLLELADPELFLLAGRYTLLEQEPLDTFLPKCTAHCVGVVIGGPFNSGVLAGKAYYDYDSVPRRIAEKVDAISKVCRAWNVSLVEAALHFPLSHPAVVSVIPGAQSAAEILGSVSALKRAAPVGFWDDLKRANLISAQAPTPEAVSC